MSSRFACPLAVKVVIMDLDGTLVDTAPDIAASTNAMLQDLGLPTHDQDTIATWIGSGASRLVRRALTEAMDGEPPKDVYEQAYRLFLQQYGERVSRESRSYPGVIEALAALQATGFGLACITNKPDVFTTRLLKDLELHGYFELIVSGDTLTARKPDPLPLLHACEYFGVAPEHGVLVGDSANDIEAAHAAGMPVICVTYGYNRGVNVRELDPAAVIDSLTELPTYIRPYR
ncbi:MAG: phosphoglycolate phosphatase [Acidiferrobacterales bacterium]